MYFANKKIIFYRYDLYEDKDNYYYFDLRVQNNLTGYKIRIGKTHTVDRILELDNYIEIDNKFELDGDVLIPSEDGDCFVEFQDSVNWEISSKIYKNYDRLVEIIYNHYQFAERVAVYQKRKDYKLSCK